MSSTALQNVRICDLGGQLAGAGATRCLAAFGAEVIRVEDPVRRGLWDHLRGQAPFVDDRRGLELGGAFNNHNVEKKGITLNLRTDEGRELLGQLISKSDVVTENFSAGVMERLGFSYEQQRALKPDIVYVSNSGFGHTGPYRDFKSWGPIVQAFSGLTHLSGIEGLPPAGWGFSFMDHGGADIMCIAILAALFHRRRTGKGQWIDMSCTDAGVSMLGPSYLDATVNGPRTGASDRPDTNRGSSPVMVPHNVYRCLGDDEWVAIACRDDADWQRLAPVIGDTAMRASFSSLTDRRDQQREVDVVVAVWAADLTGKQIVSELNKVGVPVGKVQRPEERIDQDDRTEHWGLWPSVKHPEIGEVRVDGLPLHLSETDWQIERGAPMLGEHTDQVLGDLLKLDQATIDDMRGRGII